MRNAQGVHQSVNLHLGKISPVHPAHAKTQGRRATMSFLRLRTPIWLHLMALDAADESHPNASFGQLIAQGGARFYGALSERGR
ncbi:Uncharacterised protein [Vibrio cholerae]|nr:Uncharacterised protein [Vibrio cholerae]